MKADEMERALLAERTEPDQDFARRLDEWADAGFPRDRGLGPQALGSKGGAPAGAFRRAWDRISSAPLRQVLMPVGAAATLFVVAGVALSQSGGLDDESDQEPAATLTDQEATTSESTAGSEDSAAAPEASGSGGDSAAAAPPAAQSVAPEEPASPDEATLDAPVSPSDAAEGVGAAADQRLSDGNGGGGVAPATDDRLFDATARLTLGAEAEDVQGVANEVVAVTDRYDGVVLDSQVTTDEGGARAALTLEIPYAELDAALTDLSELGDVISRTEAGEDITQGAVRSQKQLANVLEDLNKARIELELADTRRERLILESQIDSLEAGADALRADIGQSNQQARFATVNVDITSNGSASDEDGWSLADALDDAGRVLEVIAGIALISLAVLLPLALAGTLVYLATARSRRRSRERALDEG